MKKTFITLLGIAAVAAVACQPKEEAEIANGHRISVTLTAAQPETKTYIEEVQGGWQPYWSADDAIVVTNTADFETESPKDNPFVNQSGAGINASFTGSIVAEDGEVTVHAYRPKRSNRSKGIFKFAIPATQAVPSLTTFNPDYDLLVADPLTLTVANQTVTSADPLHFHSGETAERLFDEQHFLVFHAGGGGELHDVAQELLRLRQQLLHGLTDGVAVHRATVRAPSRPSRRSRSFRR